MTRTLRLLGSLVAASTLGGLAPAQVHAPITPAAIVIEDVVLSADAAAAHMDIIVQGGRIVDVVPTGGELPPGAKRYAGEGRLALPGFIDAWTTSGIEKPERNADQDIPVEVVSDVRAAMREANRKGIWADFRAADVVDFGADGAGAWRAEGFGTLLAAPDGELIAGHGALVATREGARRDLILSPEVFQFGQFAASGRGFPSTLMGYFSQLRQYFYDAERQVDWASRYEAGQAVPRPAWDPTLDAGALLLGGRELYVVRADDANTVERWLRLAAEFDLRLAIAGGDGAWEHAARLAELGIPVILDMDLGEEPEDPNAPKKEKQKGKAPQKDEADEAPEGAPSDDSAEGAAEEADPWHYVEPKAQKLEERRLWEEHRANAQRLMEAGVRVLFGTGERKPKEFMADLRKALDGGLDRAAVRRALTTDAAMFLGLSDHLGALDAGHAATFAVWTADPFAEEGGDIALMLVDGRVYTFDVVAPGDGPAEGVDATGTWVLAFSDEMGGTTEATLELEMDDEGRVTGTSTVIDEESGEAMSTAMTGSVSGTTMTLKGTIDLGDVAIELESTSELNGDALSGESTISSPWGTESSKFTGTRRPDGHAHETAEEHYSCMHGTEAL